MAGPEVTYTENLSPRNFGCLDADLVPTELRPMDRTRSVPLRRLDFFAHYKSSVYPIDTINQSTVLHHLFPLHISPPREAEDPNRST